MRQGRRYKICLIQPQKKLPLWVREHKIEVGSRLLSVGCYQKSLSSKLQPVVSSDASSLFLRRVSPFVLCTDGDTLAALHRAFPPNICVWSCFRAAGTKLTRHMQMQTCRDGLFRQSRPCQHIHLPLKEAFLEVSSLSTERWWQTSNLPNNLYLHIFMLSWPWTQRQQKHNNNSTTFVSFFLGATVCQRETLPILCTQQKWKLLFLGGHS